MKNTTVAKEIEQLLRYAFSSNLLEELDIIPVRNALMELLEQDEPYEESLGDEKQETLYEILEKLLDYAWEIRIIKNNSVTERDLMDAKIMGLLMPRQSELLRNFHSLMTNQGPFRATEYFYNISKASNYIRMDRILKNQHWLYKGKYGELQITINLSKPEKDPKEIEASRNMKQSNYPKCLLCIENVGFRGHINHPARQNHRVIPVKLSGESWYLQYSPYVYYNEHCILLYEKHVPMKISVKTFERLLDFIEQFPHYFMGSNADLPIVGGSILSHEHFQGGRHTFPMDAAKKIQTFKHKQYPMVKASIIKWPLSVIRLSSSSKKDLIELSKIVLDCWRDYSNPRVDILAKTVDINGTVFHNTITPIARKKEPGEFEMDLVLRNNRTTQEYPEGIFHPHKEFHHIKKENIGLIEVMGLAVLPARLKEELTEIERILTGDKQYNEDIISKEHPLHKHNEWINTLINKYGTKCDEDRASLIIKKEVGIKFQGVLENAGVFKQDASGRYEFINFMLKLGFNLENNKNE